MSRLGKKDDMINEILTIYRKMKRGSLNQNIYRMLYNIDNEVEDTLVDSTTTATSVIDFCKYKTLNNKKYIFYSKETSLIESDDLFNLQGNNSKYINNSSEYVKDNVDNSSIFTLLNKKLYWLNIFNPSEKDLEILGSVLGVHDITLIDIREKNTEEKLEHFKNYLFISMKLMYTCVLGPEDIDFNILIFKNFIITTHDKQWTGIKDIINFLSTITQHTPLYPDWVFYSIIIEFLQDVKHVLENVKPESIALKAVSRNIYEESDDMTDNLKLNYEMVFKLYNFRQFIRPKILILDKLRKANTKIQKKVCILLDELYRDFKRQQKLAVEYNDILERSQDLFLALLDMEQSREANSMNKVMNRFSQIAFVFLPCQTIAGLWGMNVKVPWQGEDSVLWFYFLCALGPICSVVCYLVYKRYRRDKGSRM